MSWTRLPPAAASIELRNCCTLPRHDMDNPDMRRVCHCNGPLLRLDVLYNRGELVGLLPGQLYSDSVLAPASPQSLARSLCRSVGRPSAGRYLLQPCSIQSAHGPSRRAVRGYQLALIDANRARKAVLGARVQRRRRRVIKDKALGRFDSRQGT